MDPDDGNMEHRTTLQVGDRGFQQELVREELVPPGSALRGLERVESRVASGPGHARND